MTRTSFRALITKHTFALPNKQTATATAEQEELHKQLSRAQEDLAAARAEVGQRDQQWLAEQAKAYEAQQLAQKEWEERSAEHLRELEAKEIELAKMVRGERHERERFRSAGTLRDLSCTVGHCVPGFRLLPFADDSALASYV